MFLLPIMWKKKTVSNGENSSDNTTKAQDNFKKALDWETSRLELVEKSEKRAWLCSKIHFCKVFLPVVFFEIIRRFFFSGY